MHAFRNPWACLLLLIGGTFAGCSTAPAPTSNEPPPGPWADSTAFAVADAQDHRDGARLIALLTNGSALVREQAALALASAGDSTAVDALLKALSDDDPVVRCNAAFAYGFCGDSVNVHRIVERYSTEPNTAVRGRIAEAMGRIGGADIVPVLLRRSRATHMDTLGVLLGLYRAALNKHSDTAVVRCALSVPLRAGEDVHVIACNLLSRSDAAVLKPFTKPLAERAKAITATEPLIPLLGALAKTGDIASAGWMNGIATTHPDPRVRVAALRGLGKYGQEVMEDAVWAGLDDQDASVRNTALELMQQWSGSIDGDRLWKVAQEHADYAMKIPLYALVMKHAGAGTRSACGSLLNAMAQQDLGPYLNAELVKARGGELPLSALVAPSSSAPVRQACLEQFIGRFGVSDPLLQEPFARALVDTVFASKDAGLIARIAEALTGPEMSWFAERVTPEEIERVSASLHPIRDLETRQLLDGLLAKRE
ncbi:MAG TPA: HEAT repeat domain-containing protein, partial [Flavobacteriales bacterium]|nr:HEAT repeat domain-containing protein [Flavobacteriales bacterium]